MLHSILNAQTQPLSSKQLETILERKNELEMIDTMKSILQQAFTEPPAESYILPIIKNVSASSSKLLKRILHMFWPLVPFYDERGTLKPYTILICNSILSDLKHPNEFIQISALRCVASLEVRKVVQNVVQGIPLLLKSEIQEVRCAAGFCCYTIQNKFPGLIQTEELVAAAQLEKSGEAAAWFFKAVCRCAQSEVPSLFKTYLERFDAFREDYQVGSAIFDCFEQQDAASQEYLLQQIQAGMDVFSPVVLSSAGVALRKFPLQSALCLLQSCRNAPEAALLMVVDELRAMDLREGVSHVVQAICQIFLSSQAEKSAFKLLKSHILRKFSEGDVQSAKVIVDALVSSRIIETAYCDLYLELLSTVLETADACGGFADISIAGLQQMCAILAKAPQKFALIEKSEDTAYLAKIHAEACAAAAKLLSRVAEAAPAKRHEICKLAVKLAANCVSEPAFKALTRAIADIFERVDQQTASTCAAGFIFLLKMPFDVEAAETQQQRDFIDEIAQNNDADDDNNDQNDTGRIYQAVRAGRFPFLALSLIKTAERIAYALEWRENQFLLTRIILGCSGLLKAHKICSKDQQTCTLAIQRIFVYSKHGDKPVRPQQTADETQAPAQRQKRQDPSQSLEFSILAQEQAVPDVEKTQKFENFQTLSQDPQSLSQIHQLSADADMIYSEAIVALSKQQVTLHVLFVNRTDMPMSDVELELFAPNTVRIHRQLGKLNLEPHAASFQSYQVSITKCEAAVLYGNILGKVQQRQKQSVGRFRDLILRIQEIRLPISNFLRPFKVSQAEFQREWEIMEWESRGNLSASRADRVVGFINASVVHSIDCDLVRTEHMSCMSVQNELCLVVLSVVDGRASMRVKGNNKELVKSIVEAVSVL